MIMASKLLLEAPSVARSLHAHEWWTPRETSEFTRFAEKTLANWRSLGVGPSYSKIGRGRGRVLYHSHDVKMWLANQAVGVD